MVYYLLHNNGALVRSLSQIPTVCFMQQFSVMNAIYSNWWIRLLVTENTLFFVFEKGQSWTHYIVENYLNLLILPPPLCLEYHVCHHTYYQSCTYIYIFQIDGTHDIMAFLPPLPTLNPPPFTLTLLQCYFKEWESKDKDLPIRPSHCWFVKKQFTVR